MAYSSQNTLYVYNILMWLTVFYWIIVYYRHGMNKAKFISDTLVQEGL
jgi:hypothetical protein